VTPERKGLTPFTPSVQPQSESTKMKVFLWKIHPNFFISSFFIPFAGISQAQNGGAGYGRTLRFFIFSRRGRDPFNCGGAATVHIFKGGLL
jgi:hypothetical protein